MVEHSDIKARIAKLILECDSLKFQVHNLRFQAKEATKKTKEVQGHLEKLQGQVKEVVEERDRLSLKHSQMRILDNYNVDALKKVKEALKVGEEVKAEFEKEVALKT